MTRPPIITKRRFVCHAGLTGGAIGGFIFARAVVLRAAGAERTDVSEKVNEPFGGAGGKEEVTPPEDLMR